MTNDTTTERRLQHEAATNLLATLGDRATATDCARVEVSIEHADGYETCGYLIVYVQGVVREEEPDEELAGHPATLAGNLVQAWLEERDAREGWTYWAVDEVYAD